MAKLMLIETYKDLERKTSRDGLMPEKMDWDTFTANNNRDEDIRCEVTYDDDGNFVEYHETYYTKHPLGITDYYIKAIKE